MHLSAVGISMLPYFWDFWS